MNNLENFEKYLSNQKLDNFDINKLPIEYFTNLKDILISSEEVKEKFDGEEILINYICYNFEELTELPSLRIVFYYEDNSHLITPNHLRYFNFIFYIIKDKNNKYILFTTSSKVHSKGYNKINKFNTLNELLESIILDHLISRVHPDFLEKLKKII